MTQKALKEIKASETYFRLLGDKKINKKLRQTLIQQAPPEFFSVLTQITRHLLNQSFCAKNSNFCKKYENSLYLIALPATSKKDKQRILQSEAPELVFELYSSFQQALSK